MAPHLAATAAEIVGRDIWLAGVPVGEPQSYWAKSVAHRVATDGSLFMWQRTCRHKIVRMK